MKLYLSSVTGNLSLTGAWVAILAARGYSLAQIGLAETVFHITSILLLFFLQAKLPAAGMPNQALGAALFFMEMRGIFGSKIILKWKKPKYGNVFTVTAALVLLGVLVEHTGICLLMTGGGFLAAFADDMLQVRTNTILQDMFPSEQRATLISIESFTFSIIMVVLSPLAGILFSFW